MKKRSILIKAHEGIGIWQPSIKGDCITLKLTPDTVEKTNHTIFIHEIPNGGYVGEHAHELEEEIFICLEGEALATIDGKEQVFSKHDVLFIAPKTRHSFKTTSKEPLKFMVIISPTGLEDRLLLMGKRKISAYEAPPEKFDSPISKQSTHGVIK